MRNALSTLPWVEYRTIKADGSTRTVTLGINDMKSYSEEALRDTLSSKYQSGFRVLKGPTPIAP